MQNATIFEKYDNSIIWRRWLGTIVDTFIIVGLAAVLILIGGEDLENFWMWIWIVFILAYYIILEGLWGVTIGKLMAGIRVVNTEGDHPGLFKATIRTLFRLLEVNPVLFGALPAAISVLMTSSKQRLGDLAAGTYVFRKSDLDELYEAYFNSLETNTNEDSEEKNES